MYRDCTSALNGFVDQFIVSVETKHTISIKEYLFDITDLKLIIIYLY